MKKSNQGVIFATQACVAVVLLASTHSASADPTVTDPKNSADFFYQYNGDTVPSATGGWGNTGFGEGGGGQISGLTLTSDGDILTTTPTSSATTLNFVSWTTAQPWNTLVTDATGHTFEIRMRQKTTSEMPPGVLPGTNAHLNRAFFRIGDTADGIAAQLDASSGSLNITGDMGLITIDDPTDGLHVYRFAQAPNSQLTDVWIDEVYQGAVTASVAPAGQSNSYLQWGHPFGWTTSFEIDYVRFEVAGFAPEEVATGIPGDYNDSDQVEQGDLDLVLLNWGDSSDPAPDGWINPDFPPTAPTIDQDDLDDVLLNWGNTAAAGASAAVPEPGSVALLLLAAVGGILFHRDRTRHRR